MNAIDFIQKFGWGFSKDCVDNRLFSVGGAGGLVSVPDDLKRYVDACELVRRFGGIHMAKADSSDLDGFEKTSPYWVKVKQAITLVEEVGECNE